MRDTVAALDRHGISWAGVGESEEEAFRPAVIRGVGAGETIHRQLQNGSHCNKKSSSSAVVELTPAGWLISAAGVKGVCVYVFECVCV